ncbi:MAG TPA: hypothetical protein PK878_07515 [bacterium]|nr:hypothetical protein [bacterium]HOL94781.1 hypothetical protein [bacterium]HPP01521.1 hypothetical protein [bacterium]
MSPQGKFHRSTRAQRELFPGFSIPGGGSTLYFARITTPRFNPPIWIRYRFVMLAVSRKGTRRIPPGSKACGRLLFW